MTPQKVREVLKKYESMLVRFTDAERVDAGLSVDLTDAYDYDVVRGHILWMCREAATFPDEKVEKTMRWLGFIQGCLFCLGECTIAELKADNMPPDA